MIKNHIAKHAILLSLAPRDLDSEDQWNPLERLSKIESVAHYLNFSSFAFDQMNHSVERILNDHQITGGGSVVIVEIDRISERGMGSL